MSEPWKHINQMHVQWRETTAEAETLRLRISEIGQQHKEDLEAALNSLRADLEAQAQDKEEAARKTHEENLSKATERIKAEEVEKWEELLHQERQKVVEMEGNLETLKAVSFDPILAHSSRVIIPAE